MSDIKFACPACQQHISAEQGYAGMEISCPACSARMVVPGTPVPVPMPAPVPAPAYAVPAAPTPQAPSPTAVAGACPSCGVALPRGAVMCTKCGYNLATKQRIVAGRVVAPGKPVTQPDEDGPWYKTPYPYLGGVVAILGLLYFLGKHNPPMMLVFFLALGVYYLTVQICVIVAAFRVSIGTGFLTMCVPFYAIYYVFKVSDSLWLKSFYSLVVLIGICLRVLRLASD